MKEKFIQKFLMPRIYNSLNKVKTGKIVIYNKDPLGLGNPSSKRIVNIHINNASFFEKIIFKGGMGAAESYMNGDWSCDNLTLLLELLLENKEAMSSLSGLTSYFINSVRTIKNIFSYNYTKAAKKNIMYHYDLNNDFFKKFLDEKMLYSCALFNSAKDSLDSAQVNKMEAICQKLQLQSSDHLLEIGTGWGALAIYAATNYGCRVTTTTISEAQYDYAKEEILKWGLSDKITLIKKDYRALSGNFDKLVSIEMIESIGHQYFDKFFKICNSVLKPGGLFVLQSITINDQSYDRYKRQIDFIKKYIFPGGCLPSISTIANSIKQKSNLLITEIDDIGLHYAKTLSHWKKRFIQNKASIYELGFNDEIFNMFLYYFSYCEAGFLNRHISNVHITLEKNWRS